MRVLVTGGAGFIGSHLTRVLLEGGHDVTVLDNLSKGRREHVPENAAFVQADLADERATGAALKGHDAVIHLAGSLEVAVSVEQPVAFTENNVVNTVRLLESMRRAGVRKIVFSSSATVYGVPQRLPLREDDPLGMQANPYGASKVACEAYLAVYHEVHSFDCIVLRYFNPYGPNELCDPETHAVPNIVRAMLERRAVPVYWKGEQVRDYIYVEDLARAHVATLDVSGYEVFNLGSENGTKVIDIISACERVLGEKAQIDDRGERPGDVAANYASSEKLRERTGWRPEVDLEEGLRRTIEHYRTRLGIR